MQVLTEESFNGSVSLEEVDAYKNYGNYEELLRNAVFTGIESDVRMTLANFYKYKDKPYLKEALSIAMEKNVDAFFAFINLNFNAFTTLPYAKELLLQFLLKANSKNIYAFFILVDKNFDAFMALSYGKELLLQAAEHFFYATFLTMEKHQNSRFAKEILMTTIDKAPQNTILFIDRFKGSSFYEELLKYGLLKMIETSPDLPITYAYLYKDQPYFEEIYKRAVEECIRTNPSYIIDHDYFFTKEPDYIQRALDKAGETDPDTVLLYYNDRGEELSEADNIRIINALRKSDLSTFSIYIGRYRKIFNDFLKKNLDEAFADMNIADIEDGIKTLIVRLKEEDYVSEYLLKAAKLCPNIVVKLYLLYGDYPYSREILEEIIKFYPWVIIESQETVEGLFEMPKWALEKANESMEELHQFDNLKDEVVSVEKNNALFELKSAIILKNLKLSIPIEEFLHIFYSESFLNFLNEQSGVLKYVTAFSFVHAVYRNIMNTTGEINEENIHIALNKVYENYEKVKDREILGPNTNLISFGHEEPWLAEEVENVNTAYLANGGKKENILYSGTGSEMKQDRNIVKDQVLGAIRRAKGPTTIFFSGHGSPENWSFSKNLPGNLNCSLDQSPSDINFKELGDALIASGNVDQFNIFTGSCYGYDYIQNLTNYLEQKGSRLPYISISNSNRHSRTLVKVEINKDMTLGKRTGNSGALLISATQLSRIRNKGAENRSVTVQDLLDAETLDLVNDPSFRAGRMEIGVNDHETAREIKAA